MLKSLTLGLLVLFSAVDRSPASNCPISVNPELRTVSWGEFLGPSYYGYNHHTLISDDAQKTFDAPHYTTVPWGDPKEIRRYPTAYTKGSTPSVQMEFFLDVQIPEEHKGECKLMVRAMRDGRVYLPEQEFTLLHGPNTYTYGWKFANEAFPNQIRFYGPGIGTYDLNWQYKLEGGEYQTFHTSLHRIYLTAAKPRPSQGNRETLFYYACHQPDGDPGTDGKVVTHKIWEDFKTKSMQRINHASGYLYGNPLTFWPTSANEVVHDGTGVCKSWSDFFGDTLKVHGYPHEVVDIKTFGMTLPNGYVTTTAYWLIYDQVITSESSISNGSVALGLKGIDKGQGSGCSYDAWSSHTIAKAFDELYDPSYGIGTCATQVDYERVATPGFKYMGPDFIFSSTIVQKFIERDAHSRLKYNYISVP